MLHKLIRFNFNYWKKVLKLRWKEDRVDVLLEEFVGVSSNYKQAVIRENVVEKRHFVVAFVRIQDRIEVVSISEKNCRVVAKPYLETRLEMGCFLHKRPVQCYVESATLKKNAR